MLRQLEIKPTLLWQCLGFMVGSTFFAVGSAPVVSGWIGSTGCNILFFIGSWGFTTAAFIQLQLSGPQRGPRGGLTALWLAAATQFVGTLLFNVSTGSAIHPDSVTAMKDLVWAPNAEGSILFLVSGSLLMLVLARRPGLRGPADRDWFSTWINMLGCVAFGVSAVAAVVLPTGQAADQTLAGWGTFVGAICFFLASAVMLPDAGKPSEGDVPVSGLDLGNPEGAGESL